VLDLSCGSMFVRDMGKTDNFTPVPNPRVSYRLHRQNLGFSRVSRVNGVTVWIRAIVRLKPWFRVKIVILKNFRVARNHV